MSVETLLFLALFLLAPLVNSFLRWLQRKADEVNSAELPDRAEAPPPPSPPVIPGTRQAVEPVARPRTWTPPPVASPAPLPAPPRARGARIRLGPDAARRAVVLLAVLGPCRGNEPPHAAGGPRSV